MPGGKRQNPSPDSSGSIITLLSERPQLDFELDFFDAILRRIPDYPEVLRAQASNLTAKGRLKEGLKVDMYLVKIRPSDPTAHYNLACRYALLKQRELALQTLKKAVELGYRDFRFMIQDKDLSSLHKDPRFRAILMDYEAWS